MSRKILQAGGYKMKTKKQSGIIVLMLLGTLVVFSGCALPGSGPAAPKEIVIGASIPQSGPLVAFGSYMEWGYKKAVEEINEAGGLYLSEYDTKVPVRLILYDDESKPEKVTEKVEHLVLTDKVNFLLGSATPPLVLSGAMVAEREGIPLIAGITPIRAFLGPKPEGWNWAWDIFFDELEMTERQFQTMDMVESNKKVALFTDTDPDGVVMGGLWEEKSPKFGYEIVSRANFPIGTAEYSDFIRQAQEAEAEIVIAQMLTPDSIALWQQMQDLGYKPKAAFFEKGAEPVVWWEAHGEAAQGTMVAGYWHPKLSYPGAKALREQFEAESGELYSQHIADTYTAAKVLLNAIEQTGNLDKEAVNKAIGETNGIYVAGPIRFTEGPNKHAATLSIFMLQWQNGNLEIVYPPELATGEFVYPLP